MLHARGLFHGGQSIEGSRTGFTLVELLVVVSIIALLISILLPSLNKARETARQVKCMSNLKQFGNADAFYKNEFEGWHVPYASSDPSGGWWRWDVNPAFERSMAMRDPGNFGPSASKGQLCPGATYAQENGNGKGRYNITFSYGMNGTNDHPDQSFGNRQNSTFGFTVDQVYRPHMKMRWIDSMTVRLGRGGERGQYFRNGEQSWREVGWGGVNTAPRHHLDVKSQKGRVNAVFFDGHADTLAYSEIRSDNRSEDMILWDPLRE
jgi:prepilin-type N-terminal cleavage/methylation domain-containing protein/prepilin-type processing-associated H-X9-DG protein